MSPRHKARGAGGETSRRRGRLRFRTIRGRLGAILAIPTTLLIVVAATQVTAQVRIAGDTAATARDVDLTLSAQELIHNLQLERGLTSGLLGGHTAFRQQVDDQRKQSDQARTVLDAAIRTSGNDHLAEAMRSALGGLGDLGPIRGSVDAGRMTRTDVLAYYTTAIDALNAASAAIQGPRQDDAQLRQGLDSLRVLGDAKEAAALERGTLNGVFAAGAFAQGDYAAFMQTRATKIDALADFVRVASPPRISDLQAAERTDQAVLASSFEDQALPGADGRQLHLDPETWWTAMTRFVNDLHGVQVSVGDDVRTRAEDDRGAAEQKLSVYAAAAVLTLVIAVMLWISTIRSVLRPLRLLSSEAHLTARRHLPDAIAAIQEAEDPAAAMPRPRSPIAYRADEFAGVATALDELQTTALRLAAEQTLLRRNTSQSLANLARRTQNLVRRQLGHISALEQKETDPDQLAELFELDHLATRMRRTAESLLILAGEHNPRRWPGDIDATDVLRAAFADVEDYRRLVLRRTDDMRIRGTVSGEIAHLVAELVDNALAFSPPDREVEVQARQAGLEYHIAVVDSGLGMPPDKMAEANARLRGEGTFLAAPTRELGHLVVGRIAARLGIQVWLHESPLTGVTARIVLPPEVLAGPAGPSAAALASARPGAAAPGAAALVPSPRPPQPTQPPQPTHPFADSSIAAVTPTEVVAGTTKNGLIKRTAHPRGPADPQTVPAASAPRSPSTTVTEPSPAAVRSMLDSFRSGALEGLSRTQEPS